MCLRMLGDMYKKGRGWWEEQQMHKRRELLEVDLSTSHPKKFQEKALLMSARFCLLLTILLVLDAHMLTSHTRITQYIDRTAAECVADFLIRLLTVKHSLLDWVWWCWHLHQPNLAWLLLVG